MPTVEVRGASLWVEEVGRGAPIVCLHSGWGRKLWNFDRAAELLGHRWRFVAIDRRGYGRSTPLDHLGQEYHREAADDLRAVLEALDLETPILWGHSDGAVIAAMHAAAAGTTVAGLILEAPHYLRAKSLATFRKFLDPSGFSDRVRQVLIDEHGEDRWETVIRMHSQAWIDFHRIGGDFYAGSLREISVPTLVILGENDPHTPVSEGRQIAEQIPGAEFWLVSGGGHAPHAQSSVADEVAERVRAFLGRFATQS